MRHDGGRGDKLSAVLEAANTRLRPILMTTAATVMGHLPLVFASGPGAGARNSIAIMLVTGMIIGTAFTLFVVPSIYVLVARKRKAATEEERRFPERSSRRRSDSVRQSPPHMRANRFFGFSNITEGAKLPAR